MIFGGKEGEMLKDSCGFLPDFLKEKLISQYGEDLFQKIVEGYGQQRAVTLRVNTLKTDVPYVKSCLQAAGITWKEVPWSAEALVMEQVREDILRDLPVYQQGSIYLQSLSSMLPPILLSPEKGECILDMAAAPGGKTTQMAALSGNQAQITACEKNKVRAQRLRYNVEKQGASCVYLMTEDSRKLDDYFSFDKILLDAPCSGSGTLELTSRGVKQKITEELISRSVKTQEELLKKALKLLKPGHEMIYSTCSILREENEDTVKKILGKQAEIVPILQEGLPKVPFLPTTVEGTLCICPSRLYEGFFVAKIRKC